MITVFYLLVALCLFVEILRLLAFKKVDQGVKKYKEVKDPKDYSPLYTAYVTFGFFYFFFCLVGLMSSQWIGFVALLLLGFIPKKMDHLESDRWHSEYSDPGFYSPE